MIRIGSFFAALTLVAFLATPAMSQVCLGLPFTGGGTAITASSMFPDGATGYGASLSHAVNDSLAVSLSVSTLRFKDSPFETSPFTVGAAASYSASVASGPGGPAISLCPVAGTAYTRWEVGGEDLNTLAVPLGVGMGVTLPIAEGAMLTPYAVPQFIWSRQSWGGHSETDTEFGFTLGGNIAFGALLFGGTFSKFGDADGFFGLNVGVRF